MFDLSMGYLSVVDLRKIPITNPFLANKLNSTSLECLTQDTNDPTVKTLKPELDYQKQGLSNLSLM